MHKHLCLLITYQLNYLPVSFHPSTHSPIHRASIHLVTQYPLMLSGLCPSANFQSIHYALIDYIHPSIHSISVYFHYPLSIIHPSIHSSYTRSFFQYPPIHSYIHSSSYQFTFPLFQPFLIVRLKKGSKKAAQSVGLLTNVAKSRGLAVINTAF